MPDRVAASECKNCEFRSFLRIDMKLNFKPARANARISEEYFAEQNRANGASGEYRTVTETVEKIVNGRRIRQTVTHIVQSPMEAVLRPTFEPAQPIPERRQNDALAERTMVKAPEQTGAPVSVTGADYRASPPEIQQQIRAQALNFEGARERIRDHGTTLADAFYAELDYQASLQRGLARAIRDGKATRFSKAAAKRDNAKGYRKLKPGGTASMALNRRETIVRDGFLPGTSEGYVGIRPIRRDEPTQIDLIGLKFKK